MLGTHRLGLGFTPAYADGRLPIPEACTRLEAGAALFLTDNPTAGALSMIPDRALHLARAPFCEDDDVQDAFLGRLLALSPEVGSIGLHLCGPLLARGGEFGLGTPFEASPSAVHRAVRLATMLRQRLHDKVLHIENANLYPASLQEALGVIRATNEIAQRSGARLIVDLAHVVIAAHNLDVPSGVLLGATAWEYVDVLHVSGVTRDRRGAFHDGHNHPVASEVWDVLSVALELVDHPVAVVLEHTDESWAARANELLADWSELRARVAPSGGRREEVDIRRAAVGYMANLVLPRRFPSLRAALEPSDWRSLVEEWAADFLKRSHGATLYAFLRPEERFLPDQRHSDVIADFATFVEAYGTTS